jgi:hypothetical protein
MTGWGEPVGAPEREAFSPSLYKDCTVGVHVIDVQRDVPSQYGGTKDAARANVIVIYDPSGAGRAGEEFGSIRLFNPGIVDRVRDSVGRTVIGRLVAVAGQNPGNPAIVLNPPTPEELTYATQFLAGRTAPAPTPPPATPPFQQPAPPAPPSQQGNGSWGGQVTPPQPQPFGAPPPPPSQQRSPDDPPF